MNTYIYTHTHTHCRKGGNTPKAVDEDGVKYIVQAIEAIYTYMHIYIHAYIHIYTHILTVGRVATPPRLSMKMV